MSRIGLVGAKRTGWVSWAGLRGGWEQAGSRSGTCLEVVGYRLGQEQADWVSVTGFWGVGNRLGRGLEQPKGGVGNRLGGGRLQAG